MQVKKKHGFLFFKKKITKMRIHALTFFLIIDIIISFGNEHYATGESGEIGRHARLRI